MIIREFRGLSYVDFPSEYCLVDIETTGLTPGEDSIIEIGAIKYSNAALDEQFQTLVQPPAHDGNFVDSFISSLTGITNEMLAIAPDTRNALLAFSEFLGDSIIVGYNVSFDVNFLYDDYIKHLQRPLTNNFVDILRLSRRLCSDLPSRDLDSMLAHFNLKIDNRHRAIGDCIAAQLVYDKLQFEVLKTYSSLEEFSKSFKAYGPVFQIFVSYLF